MQDDHDQFVQLAENGMYIFAQSITPGAYLVDVLPVRRSQSHDGTMANTKHCCIVQYIPEWFPGAGFKRTARKWKEQVQEMVDQPHQWVKEQMVCYFEPIRNTW